MAYSKPQRLHKPRFKDWLVTILNTNSSQDARWVDRSNGIAVIRWPHKSRGNWTLENDARLFKMWAVISGKYRGPGCDEPNPKSWKCNFRMNLNICKDIQEIKARRVSKGPKACRYFQIFGNGESPDWFSCNQARMLIQPVQQGCLDIHQSGGENNSYPPMTTMPTDFELFNTNQFPDDPYPLPYAPIVPTSSPSLTDLGLPPGNLTLPINNYDTAELARMADHVGNQTSPINENFGLNMINM